MRTDRKIVKAIRRMALLLAILCIFSFSYQKVYAAEDGKPFVICSRTADDGIYVYIKNISGIETGSTVQVGNVSCDDIMAAPIASSGIPIQTVILLDNSLSFSGIWGDNAKALINAIIDNHLEGELFSIYTFSDELKLVSEYSADYESLKGTVNEIAYENQDSFLTDALYTLLMGLQENESSNYLRLIVIADGADENEITYTQNELTELMKKGRFPVYTVGAKSGKNNNELETLFSYARRTNAEEFVVDKNTGIEEVSEALKADYSLNCLKIIPDKSLLDGSVKETRLTIVSGDAQNTIDTSLQMPFELVGSSQTEETVVEEEAEPATEEAVEEEPEEEPEEVVSENVTSDSKPQIVLDSTPSDKEEKTGIALWVIIVIVVAAVVVCAAGAGAVFFIRKKKSNANNQAKVSIGGSAEEKEAPAETPVYEKSENKTQMLNLSGKGDTVMLFGNGSGKANQTVLVLTDTEKPDRVFKAEIESTVTVGRTSGADIVLDFDQSVSGKHCEFTKKGGLYYLKDLNSSNGTKYGGVRLTQEIPIMSGGIVEIGRGKYRIEIKE